MDVDGTLTDGKIYMGADGEAFKAFDIKDGYALHTLLKEHGIIPVIITARESPMVEHRCKELGVTEIHQGIMKKLDCLKGILEKYSSTVQLYDLSNVAYIGDDLLDLQCMKPIKDTGGLIGCPSNAVTEVTNFCDYVAPHKGGEGAVRDFAEYVINPDNHASNDWKSVERQCVDAIRYLSKLQGDGLSLGKRVVNDNFFYSIIEYETTNESNKPYESHKRYVDIQMLLSGEEIMQTVDTNRLLICEQYDYEKDCVLYCSSDMAASIVLRPGSIMVLYPKDAHRSISFDGKSCKVKKIVGKVRI